MKTFEAAIVFSLHHFSLYHTWMLLHKLVTHFEAVDSYISAVYVTLLHVPQKRYMLCLYIIACTHALLVHIIAWVK